ncbi:low molecular weight protein-tyrosine-phosphatase [Homoserinibacter sp. YIM 151385]|uniref:low molecular weight protein-tyrosine-phosphatase n=1 Tax=Homoserinibacter sp. YIM 151385 TaxID=2985506 RepID=UPI0022F0B5FA|nr:low molecular weight protein-tyrosine-phosphatase [Homoserinibacter sp. YIM 151385]WBU37269.1 low molecular weight phosphotyrosine protein phosphatase [Homoserinibacter sp. YIM 151385]
MTPAPRGGAPAPFRVCFVCTGNICRSPMAEAVFRDLIRRHGMERSLQVSSAATGDWHVGENADHRTVTALAARGYDGSEHRAKQFDPAWFDELDLVVAFDRGQARILRAQAPTELDHAKVHLLLGFDPESGDAIDVPDPYYSDAVHFAAVLAMIERASLALFSQIEPGIRQGAP